MVRDIGRLIWCVVGAAAGMGLVFWIVGMPSPFFLLASISGSSVYLFSLTKASATQPRALFGGHLGSAFIGILCLQLCGDTIWVYVLAMVLTLIFMLVTRTVHPPAGANALIMIHDHATLAALWHPVFLSIIILALVAVVWSRIIPGMIRYPTKWLEKSPSSASWDAWIE